MCPYLPFSARVCLNQHHWLANRMREEGLKFRQSTNVFLSCGDPGRLQELADSLTAQDLLSCGRKWPMRVAAPVCRSNEYNSFEPANIGNGPVPGPAVLRYPTPFRTVIPPLFPTAAGKYASVVVAALAGSIRRSLLSPFRPMSFPSVARNANPVMKCGSTLVGRPPIGPMTVEAPVAISNLNNWV